MSLERAIYAKLMTIAFSGNSPASDNRLYHLRAPQNSPAPFVIFQRTASDRWRHINGPTGMVQVTMQIDTYAETSYSARELAELIEGALDGFSGVISYGSNSPQSTLRIGGISCQSDVDLIDQTDEPFLYRVSADYLITYEQP